ncbi:MAG TPA: SpvB/TcaC N-terminal domain-containing protein, partial [Flavisolibacter sp.]|nr:SpvB/TcaC N-terminal domain-containing protein [Flavisolibacter sp.]
MKSFPLRLLALLIPSLCASGFTDPPAPQVFSENHPLDPNTGLFSRGNTGVPNGFPQGMPTRRFGDNETKQIQSTAFLNRSGHPAFTNNNNPGNTIRSKHVSSAGFVPAGRDVKLPKVSKWAGTKATDISLTGAKLHLPAGAISSPTLLSIAALRAADIRVLDPGLVNVTKEYAGYRFLPHGSRFARAVTLSMEYDETRIPKGYTANDIVTFYFDTKANHWLPLHKDSTDVANKRILSTTTHFTDMINGVLQVPESPETEAYTPNTMSGIVMPDATSEIVTIAPPTANQMGSAALTYPIKLPAGRNGMEPELAVQYNSDGGDNWLGVGWDLNTPAVTIETRWGVPRYNPAMETETYTVNGEQLSPVAHRSDPVARTGEKQFHPRVENDFQKIIRHGDNPKNYWWEATEKNGVRRFFGGTPGQGIDPAAILKDANGNIAYWALT